MEIREAFDNELEEIMKVECLAFDSNTEPKLVLDLLSDPTAKPTVSLVAHENNEIIGHILFSRAYLDKSPSLHKAYILAPLAVLPRFQNRGIGGNLTENGLEFLTDMNVSLVFVLGHPGFYSKFGFTPAGSVGFRAPFPIPDIHANAWMVNPLKSNLLGKIKGTIRCADTLCKPEYWRE